MARFAFVLLGPPILRRIEDDGREVELFWRLRRSLQVAAFLALQRDRRAHKDELIDAIWPETSAAAIQKNFHPVLADARRTLDPQGRKAIQFHHGIYALNPEDEWQIDVEELRRLLSLGKSLRAAEPEEAAKALASAWELHRGPFFAGFNTPWIVRQREEFDRDYLEVLRELGSLCDDLERIVDAIDAYRALLLEEPYEELIYQKLMELYARQGRRDLVRRQYVLLQDRLKELDIEPLEATQSCYHRLMR